jgi:hypothetical protein
MQPEAFPPGFVATHHRRGFRQTKTSFGLGDFLEQARLVTRCDRALTRLLPMPRGAAKLPGFFTQFKGQKQDTLCCGIRGVVGRGGHYELSLHGETVYGYGKEAYQQRPVDEINPQT